MQFQQNFIKTYNNNKRENNMSTTNPNFSALEQKLANDNSIEKAIKNLHEALSNEIERNRKNLFYDVKNTLADFTEKLEKSVSFETEKKVLKLFEKYSKETKQNLSDNLEKALLPILIKGEANIKKVEEAGIHTLRSWEQMMRNYRRFWTKPVVIMFFSSISTGCIIFLIMFFLQTPIAAYMFMNLREKQAYESELYRLELTKKLRMNAAQKRVMSQKSVTESKNKIKSKKNN